MSISKFDPIFNKNPNKMKQIYKNIILQIPTRGKKQIRIFSSKILKVENNIRTL